MLILELPVLGKVAFAGLDRLNRNVELNEDVVTSNFD
jgi:hypothetical protein